MNIIGWHSSIDYIRLTAPHYERGLFPLWRKLARLAAVDGDELAQERENSHWLQYHGTWYGPAFVGHSDNQGILLLASGATAHAVALRYDGPIGNVARLDPQVTIWYDEDDPAIAERAAELHLARRKPTERQPKPVLRKTYGNGDTAYFGTRGGSGSNYVRVYDKWREKHEPVYQHAWRWEAELTNRRALPVYDALKHVGWDHRAIAAQVAGHAAQRLVDVPELPDIAPYRADSLPKAPATDESRLRWLESQVKPAVAKLAASGYNRDYLVRLILGLGDNQLRIEREIEDEC